MPKITKSRLLKWIPFFGFVFFLAVFVGLYLADVPANIPGPFAFGPALFLFLVAIGAIRLQTAILLQGATLGVWWQYGDGPYYTTIIGTLVGLKLGEWIENRWRSAIDRANAEDGPEGTGNTKQNGETDRRQPV